MGTAEAAAAATPADGDPGSAHVEERQRRWGCRRRVGRPSAPVTYAVLAGLHLPHSS